MQHVHGFAFITAAFLLLLGAAAGHASPQGAFPTGSPPSPATEQEPARQDELILRNNTSVTVTYWVRPHNSEEEPATMTIQPEEIHRIPTTVAMNVWFTREDGETRSYRLDAGLPYVFRYDHQGQVDVFQGAHGPIDVPDLAPWVPTPMTVVDAMLDMAEVTADDVVYDLGCGDGRIVIAAARDRGARGVGVDIDAALIRKSNEAAIEAGVQDRVEFRLEDALKQDLTDATVVMLYLLTESNELLRPIMEEQLRPGTRIVAHDYPVPGWEPVQRVVVEGPDLDRSHTLMLYVWNP